MVLPRAAIPEAPLASPLSKIVGAHENRKRETETVCPGLKPLVDWIDKTSSASSPLVTVWVTVLSASRPHVLLLQPGFGDEKQPPQPGLGDEKQSPQSFALAREHWAEPQRAGRYVEEVYLF